jgi:hypothetical protein
MTDGNDANPSGQGEDPYRQPPYGPPPTQPYGQPYGQGTPPPYGQPPYQQPYGQPQSQPYGQPYGQPGWPAPPGYQGYPAYPGYGQSQDGGAQAAMIVGIVALGAGLLCFGFGFLASPVAWILGHRAKRRIDASQGQLGGRGNAEAGFVLGIVGTVLLIVGILAVIAFLVLVGLSVDSWELDSGTSGTNA